MSWSGLALTVIDSWTHLAIREDLLSSGDLEPVETSMDLILQEQCLVHVYSCTKLFFNEIYHKDKEILYNS